MNNNNLTAEDVAKFLLDRAFDDGELISPLKMQKLVYYAYAWFLVKTSTKLFEETIEAWANGPVVPTLYEQLKHYGSAPIDSVFLDWCSEEERNDFLKRFTTQQSTILNSVYEEYMTMTAFELVILTHTEKPWAEARKGLMTTESSNKPISDKLIIEQYGEEK